MSKLTAAKVRALTEPGRYPDGGTLYLNVAPGRSKSWVQRLTINGRRCELGLGGWPVVSLADARERAMDNRRLVRAGRDPLAEKRRVRVPTFRVATKGFLETHRRRWSASHATAWWKSFENHVFPRFGDRRVDQIASADVLALLLRLSVQHPDAARRLRDRIRRVFASCLSHGFVQTNVAGEVIDDALPDGRPRPSSIS